MVLHGVRKQLKCIAHIARLQGFPGLLTAVMGQANAEIGFPRSLQQSGDLLGLAPLSRAFVNGQTCQTGLTFVGAGLELAQGVFRAVEQTGFHKVQGQTVLGPLAIRMAEVGPGQKMLMHSHRPVVFATTPEKVAQRKMKLRSVGVVLDCLDERIDGFILLLVEEVIETLEVGAGSLPVGYTHLSQIQS